MVRTRRSIEEEARVRWLEEPCLDPLSAQGRVQEALIERVVQWGGTRGKRALVVGLEDGGRIALGLLRKGLFVTVVDPSQEAIASLKEAAEKEKIGLGLNTFADSYMSRDFSISSFDLVVIYAALNHFSEPFVVVRKAKREMKVGARFFGRINTRPEIPLDKLPLHKIPQRITGIVGKVWERLKATSVFSIYSQWPTAQMALEGFKQEFSVEDVVLVNPLVVTTGVVTSKLGLSISRVEGLLSPLEERIPEPWRMRLGGSLGVFALKERELGRTFKPGTR